MSDENLQTRCNRWVNCVVLLDFSYPIALISWVILILFTKYVSQTQFYFSDVMNILTKSYVWFDRKIVCRKSYKDRIFGIYVIIDFTNVRNFQAASSTVIESWTFNAKTMWVAENGNLDENFMRSIPKIPYHGYSCNRCQKILIKKVSESTKISFYQRHKYPVLLFSSVDMYFG